MDKAEECKNRNSIVYYNTLAELFGEIPLNIRHAYYLLMKLPFKGYITTNYDPLLSEVADQYKVYSYPDISPFNIALDEKPVFYIHGLARCNGIPTGENLILARSDFGKAYNNNITELKTFLSAVLMNFPIIFLGCRLTELPIVKIFEEINNLYYNRKKENPNINPPEKYIILPTLLKNEMDKTEKNIVENNERVEDERMNSLEIKVIRYKPHNIEEHREIEKILEYLRSFHTPRNPYPSSSFMGGL